MPNHRQLADAARLLAIAPPPPRPVRLLHAPPPRVPAPGRIDVFA